MEIQNILQKESHLHKYITEGEPFTQEIECIDMLNKDDKPKEVVKLV